MKKLVGFYAVIAAMCLTACGITPTDNAVETTVSVSETTEVNEEILRADSIGHNEQPQNGVKYLLWSSEKADISVYGIKSDQLQQVMIEYNGKSDIFEKKWYGVYSSVMGLQHFGDSDLVGILHSEGGSGTAVRELTLFNFEDGAYKMYSPNKEEIVSAIEKTVKVTADENALTVSFTTANDSCLVSTEGYGSAPLKSTDIYCSGRSWIDYEIHDGKIYCCVPFSYMMTDFAYAETEINFSDGAFSIGEVAVEAFINKVDEREIVLPLNYSLSGFEQAADEIDVTFENSELVAEEIVIEGDGGVFADVYSHNISVMNNTYHELVYIKDGAAEKMYGGFIHGRITTACADGREFAVVVPEVWMTPADIDPVTPCRAFTSLNGRPVEVTCGERQLYAYLKDPVQLMALNDDGDEIWCHKDTEKINSGKYIQQLIFEDGVLTVTDEAAVPTAQEQAEVFAELVYQKLEDEKNSENPTGFFPVDSDREQPKTSFDPEGFNADIFLLDVNSDGVPELFAGTHGTMGNGNYTVFSADGTVYGSDIFSWNLIDYCQINETMYVKSGNNFYGGWVKLTEGLPSIYVHNYDLEGSSNEVDFIIGGEVKEKWTGLSFDEVKELYTEFLDVDYDKLKGQEDICHVRGVLEVPDPENYTKEDIYSCLEALTAEYEKNSPIKASAVLENTEDILAVGYEKGMYYKEICAEYFHTSAHIHWIAGSEEMQFADDERMYIPVNALAQDDKVIEMNYDEVKKYFGEMGISENAFEQFKENAYGAYYEFDGQLYVGVKDGGMWGWDYAFIDSFTRMESGEVVYSCKLKGDSTYPETVDKTLEFTFSLKKNGDIWELYDCSDPYLFAAYFNNTELENAEKTLFTGEYENRSEFKSEGYSAVSAYTIENSGEYSENAELLKKAEYDGRILFRHIKITDENVNISWYDSGFAPVEAPYKYQDVTRSMEKVPLCSDKGRELFPEDEKFAEENGSDAGQVYFMNINLDEDGSEDTLAFVTAPWIQGQNHNITLSVRTSDGKTAAFAEPVYMLTDDNGIVVINICRTFTNGMPDFETETIDYTTSACTVRRYKFNGIEYVKET